MKLRKCLGVLLLTTAGGTALAQSLDNHLSTFFVGRVKYGKNEGRDCSGVGQNMVKLVSQVSTIFTLSTSK